MAPPGFAPPSYAHGNIPTRYMHKDPPPPGADTNGRAYLIFFSYLTMCFSLTVFIIYKLIQSYHALYNSRNGQLPQRKHIRLFSILAVGSLVTTWWYMIQYFKISYKTWFTWRSFYDLEPHHMHWGLWLKETSLFREAWETAIVGNARYWWTHQIFFFACGLGLSLEQKGIRRGIKHTWAFMLLGQIVAISFATNLYLLSLLLSPPPPPPPKSTEIYRRRWLGPWIINLLVIALTEGPAYMLADEHYWYHQTDFMPMLLTPHIALMVLPLARAVIPEKYFTDSNIEFAGTVYKFLWASTLFGGGLLFVRVTGLAYGYSGILGIFQQLSEHPAVCSVAFDVIFCWLTWFMWFRIQKQSPSEIEAEDSVKGGEWTGDATTSTVSAVNEGGVRRRKDD